MKLCKFTTSRVFTCVCLQLSHFFKRRSGTVESRSVDGAADHQTSDTDFALTS